jgi:hypothetical protein
MAMNLLWKVRAAARIVSTLSFLFVSFYASSQSPPDRPITLTENATEFHVIVEKLNKITGLNFIYSSNKVEVNKKISINFSGKSIDHVLGVLGNKMNLSLNRKDNYVVVRPLPEPAKRAANNFPETKITAPNKIKTNFPAPDNSTLVTSSDEKSILPSKVEELDQDALKYIKRNLPVLSHYFDTTLLRQLRYRELTKINVHNRHRGFFVSAGLRVNDFSAGLEIQAGLRSIYLIAQPGLLQNKSYHGAYGLGSSMLLDRNFSFTPSYTFSTWSRKETLIVPAQMGVLLEELQTHSTHHQFKVLFQ